MVRATLMAVAWMSVSASRGFPADADPLVAYPITRSLPALAGDVDWARTPVRVNAPESCGALLPSLYVGLATVNALDGYTTAKMFAVGASEANPLMRGIAGHPAALWAIKGAATAGSIYFAERLRKQHHRRAAIVSMLMTNGLIAGAAANNLRILHRR
jgi:hypothetical protein